jgi:hypothetical protein
MFSNIKNALSNISDSVSNAVALSGVDKDLKVVLNLLKDKGYEVTKSDDGDLFSASQHGFTFIIQKKESFVIFEFMKSFTDEMPERIQNQGLKLFNIANGSMEICSVYTLDDNLCFRSYVNPVGISVDSLTAFEHKMIDDITLAVDVLENWSLS